MKVSELKENILVQDRRTNAVFLVGKKYDNKSFKIVLLSGVHFQWPIGAHSTISRNFEWINWLDCIGSATRMSKELFS
jgi:hypothetical protein